MWGHWFLASLLATTAHGFAPAPIRWGGLVARRFVVAPATSASTDKALVSPLKLTVWDSSKVSPDAVPHFSANRDDTITWDATGWCLEASGTKRGDAVQVSDCTGGPAQRWKWLPWGPIQLKGTNQCLDVFGAGSDLDGASIELQTCENKASESWMFEDEAPPPSPSQQHGILFNFVASMAVAMTLGLSAWLWRWQQGLRPTIVSQHSLQRSMDWKGINLSETFATRQVRTPWLASDNASTHERVHAVMVQSPEPADDGAADDFYSQCMAMKSSELKAELDLRKISYAGLIEKEELAKLLAESRRTGKADPEVLNNFNKEILEKSFRADEDKASDDDGGPDLSDVVAGDGSLPGGISPEKLQAATQNPEVMALLSNTKLQDIMRTMMSDGPEATQKKLASDPEARELLEKFQKLQGELGI